jgi:predicted amidohydrolase
LDSFAGFNGNLDDIVNMTVTAYEEGAQYIVWPEVYVHPDRMEETCENYVRSKIVPKLYPRIESYLVVGCEQAYMNSTCPVGNIAVTIDAKGKILGTYGKEHPVTMIGEQSCFRNGYKTYDTPALSFSTLICYDIDFEDSTAIVSDLGASLILNPSEDWSAARTHFAASVFRAIENRVAIVKSDWGWDSAIISPTGEVVAMFNSKSLHREILTANVSVYPHGSGGWNRIRLNIFPVACIIILGALLVRSLKVLRADSSRGSNLETRLLY